ncbi:MAG: DNA helicase RecG, partial [Cyanobium sp.]
MDTFSGFVQRSLGSPPEGLPSESLQMLVPLREGFSRYGELSLAGRQQLVRQLRQGLHQVLCRSRTPLPVCPPRVGLVACGARGPGPARAAAGGRGG